VVSDFHGIVAKYSVSSKRNTQVEMVSWHM
jgi:hypothetical protein